MQDETTSLVLRQYAMVNKCKQKADAALAAQEAYDEYHSASEKEE